MTSSRLYGTLAAVQYGIPKLTYSKLCFILNVIGILVYHTYLAFLKSIPLKKKKKESSKFGYIFLICPQNTLVNENYEITACCLRRRYLYPKVQN